MDGIESVSFVGLGALGMLFGSDLVRGAGESGPAVRFVMDAERLARHAHDVYTVNGEPVDFELVSAEEAPTADLVIVGVKSPQLTEALDTMATSVGPQTIIMSMLNGITSEEVIAERYPGNPIVYTVAQGMDAMRTGTDLVYTVHGELHIGAGQDDTQAQQAVEVVAALFSRCGVPYVAEEDILWRMWFKYMLNVGINQVCMVYDTGYGVATQPGSEAYLMLVCAMREVQALAKRRGIDLDEDSLQHCIELERRLDPEARPSMAQDRLAGRFSEVDLFAGTVCELGKRWNVLTPVNERLLAEVRQIESTYTA